MTDSGVAAGSGVEGIDREVGRLFALVSEALARATDALLSCDFDAGRQVVAGDRDIDELTRNVDRRVWDAIESGAATTEELRHLVGVLLLLPELERSADLAEHVAQRAVDNIGAQMTPLSRGIVQRMTEVALDMWRTAADAYVERTERVSVLQVADDEIDQLHDRLTAEIAGEVMSAAVAAQVTLLARFYERLGDHAVNLARRIALLPSPVAVPPAGS